MERLDKPLQKKIIAWGVDKTHRECKIIVHRTYDVLIIAGARVGDLALQIEAVLERFWDEHAFPVPIDPVTTSDLLAPLDSMSVLEVLMEVDEIVGMKLDAERVIRKGGYDTREQFINELTSCVLDEVRKERR